MNSSTYPPGSLGPTALMSRVGFTSPVIWPFVDLDGFIEAEIHMDADRAGRGDDQRVGQRLGHRAGGEGGGHGLNGGRTGAGLQVADGGAGEDDVDLGVGVGGDVVHVEQRLQAVVAGEVDGGRCR